VLCGGGVGGGLRHRSRGEATRWSEREGAETDWEKRRKKNLILYLKSNKSNGEKIIYHCGRPMSIVHPSLSP